MSRNRMIILTIVTVIALLGLAPMSPGHAQEAPPSYQLQYLGPGSPVAMNNNGVVVGRVLLSGTSNYQPLVSSNGSPWVALPVPNGAMSVFPMDVNDSGVIVGVSYSPQWNPVAIRWTPSGSGYTVEELPRLSGDTSSYATGINNLGQVVGARRALGYAPTGSGWLYSAQLGVVDLAAQYGWWSWPSKINDLGQVIGGAERLDINSGVVEWIGNGPTNYNAVSAVDINNTGMMVGSASLRSSSLNIVSVFRYEGAAGWQYIDGTSKYTFASNINNRGDIGYGELGAGLYLDGLGKYALWSLLDPAVVSAGWTITGSGALINDQRLVATVASNSSTGLSGGVLLTPAGTLPPPSAPANLQGVAHPATQMEPYNSINLTWENTSSLTQGYELERSATGTGVWARLTLTPPGTATNHTDTTVSPGVTYDYRVRATGLGGASPWSNIVTVTAPASSQNTLRVTAITLSGRVRGNKANITGEVTIKDQLGQAVPNASVAIRWTLPDGSARIATANTGSNGRARFTVSGSRGTYTLTVTDVTKSGYVFDAAGSVLSKSITK